MKQAGRLWILLCLIALPGAVMAQSGGHESHRMVQADGGSVMNANPDRLPGDCTAIAADHALEIRAGADQALSYPGLMFAYDVAEWRVKPCSRLTVTLHNTDAVRHQWMVHGLPRYLYPGGMFHIEAAGGTSQTGVFILPGDDATYLVHCDMAQHMEKGMKGQLVAGAGGEALWAVPGISAAWRQDAYLPEQPSGYLWLALLGGLLAGLLLLRS